ncbi:hypothetical protein PR048_000910 [Dryococelus australis]|uniref:Uncharacterized protein n=1 Tax=Dryococelus australis TaxID=614101 RepID=A0ABQ9IG03_9NEOP|nr:hypothetical protein PR048_000910 [Dryococelus australis]
MPISTAHWLSTVTVKGDDWTPLSRRRIGREGSAPQVTIVVGRGWTVNNTGSRDNTATTEPIADLHGNKKRTPYRQVWSHARTVANEQTSATRLYKGLWSLAYRTRNSHQIQIKSQFNKKNGGSGGTVASALASHHDDLGSLLDFLMWESCWTMPLAGGFLGVLPFPPALYFQRRSILGSHFMSCSGMTGSYGSRLESPSLEDSKGLTVRDSRGSRKHPEEAPVRSVLHHKRSAGLEPGSLGRADGPVRDCPGGGGQKGDGEDHTLQARRAVATPVGRRVLMTGLHVRRMTTAPLPPDTQGLMGTQSPSLPPTARRHLPVLLYTYPPRVRVPGCRRRSPGPDTHTPQGRRVVEGTEAELPLISSTTSPSAPGNPHANTGNFYFATYKALFHSTVPRSVKVSASLRKTSWWLFGQHLPPPPPFLGPTGSRVPDTAARTGSLVEATWRPQFLRGSGVLCPHLPLSLSLFLSLSLGREKAWVFRRRERLSGVSRSERPWVDPNSTAVTSVLQEAEETRAWVRSKGGETSRAAPCFAPTGRADTTDLTRWQEGKFNVGTRSGYRAHRTRTLPHFISKHAIPPGIETGSSRREGEWSEDYAHTAAGDCQTLTHTTASCLLLAHSRRTVVQSQQYEKRTSLPRLRMNPRNTRGSNHRGVYRNISPQCKVWVWCTHVFVAEVVGVRERPLGLQDDLCEQLVVLGSGHELGELGLCGGVLHVAKAARVDPHGPLLFERRRHNRRYVNYAQQARSYH